MKNSVVLVLGALMVPFVSFALAACTGAEGDGTDSENEELRTGAQLGESCDSSRSCQVGLSCEEFAGRDAGSPPIRVGLPQPFDAGSPPIRVGLPQPFDAGSPPIRVGLPQPIDAGSPPIRVGLPQPIDAGSPPTGRGVCVREAKAQLNEICESGFAAPGSPGTRSCDANLVCFKAPRDPNGPTDADFGVCKPANKAQLGEICESGFAAPGSPGTRSCDVGLSCVRGPRDPNGPTDADFGFCKATPIRVGLPQFPR